MDAVDERIELTLDLPRDLVNRVSDLAASGHHSVEDEIRQLVERGVRSKESLRESIRKAREESNAPLQTTEELWEQMRRIREEVADELYPD